MLRRMIRNRAWAAVERRLPERICVSTRIVSLYGSRGAVLQRGCNDNHKQPTHRGSGEPPVDRGEHAKALQAGA